VTQPAAATADKGLGAQPATLIPDVKQPTAIVPATPTRPAPTPTPGITPITKIEGFPEDVPLLTDNNGDLTTQKNSDMNLYSFSTQQSLKYVMDFYQAGMLKNGWEVVNTMESGDQTVYYFSKGDTRMVMITILPDEQKTMIMIMVPLTN
jgi:hypothetical protein